MLIRLIIIGIFVFFLFRIIRALFSPQVPSSSVFRDEGERIVNDMAQDPHCGVYVDTKQAFSAPGREMNYSIFAVRSVRKKYLQ